MPTTTPARERTFTETGFFMLPVEIFSAQLGANATLLYCWLCHEADAGHNPPETPMATAIALGITVGEAIQALHVLKNRNLVIVRSATDWHLTEPREWKGAAEA